MSKKVLVTGGAGFIGSHLTDKLLAEGYQVTVLDNLVNGRMEHLQHAGLQKKFRFIKGDVLNKRDCAEAVRGHQYVFHLACLGVRHSLHSPFDNHRVNAEGTLNMLEAARSNGVKHFFYISTSEVYGQTNSFPITESAPTHPTTVYGASKLAGEHYSMAYHIGFGLPVTLFRIFNNFGPRAHHEGDAGELIPRTIVSLLYNQSPVVFGDGNVTRDFFYVADTADALTKVLEQVNGGSSDFNGQLFNIGTGTEISIGELVLTIRKIMGKTNVPIRFLSSRPADVPRLWVLPQKFQEATGFSPTYSFEKGLLQTIAYYHHQMQHTELIQTLTTHNWIP